MTNKSTRTAQFLIGAALAACLPAPASAQSADETATAKKLEDISDDPLKLRMLLQQMPKGADLHNHLDGGPYAEEYLKWAGSEGLCLDTAKLALAAPPCNAPDTVPMAGLALRNPGLWSDAIDNMSLRGHNQGVSANDRSGHEAFFSTFGKFGAVAEIAVGESIASALRAAAADKAFYIELIDSPGALFEGISRLGSVKWNSSDMDEAIDAAAPIIADIVREGSAQTDAADQRARDLLACGSASAEEACDVTYRFLTFSLRNGKPDDAFRSLLISFAMVASDPRYVGVNIVGPEDEFNSVENYDEHMRMIAYLSARYPEVKKSLHAGELALGLAPAYALKDHIRKAIEIAGADRIGHGTDIAFEDGALLLLDEMAARPIPVEINLSSNDSILGITGSDHPLNLYLDHGVPVMLSTDDQGVLRIDLTGEYVRAVREHGLDYGALKRIARNNLEYAFLPGPSLWQDGKVGVPVAPCSGSASASSATCRAYLDTSEKATLQMELEERLRGFESSTRQF